MSTSMTGRLRRGAVVMLLGVTALAGPVGAGPVERLGQAHLPVSCTPDTQQAFDRALALLHSFWYEEALKAFTAVTETDPPCAMGYWGIAMSVYYPLWQPPSEAMLKRGWEAVQKAKGTATTTERERDYIAAIETFYRDSDRLDHRTRAVAYEQAMERLYRRYPDDREAAIFYALALDATAPPTDKTYANSRKAAAILEKVFAEQPGHPGVAHYLIHSYDYPALATQGLDAARRYARIAPSVPHAQHMPSHIFTRVGLWQESIDSNRASAAAGREYFRNAGTQATWDQTLHALDYLAYAYLQGAQDQEAKRVVDEVASIRKTEPESRAAAYALAAIPARYAIERERWAEAASLSLPAGEFPWGRYAWGEAIVSFARGLGAARSGDVAGARREVSRLESFRDALAAAKDAYWADQVEVQRRAVAAWAARGSGLHDEAIKSMRSAADLEASMEKSPVTPAPVVPARELLGTMLLELGQARLALTEFETSLRAEPNRFRGLAGAARAAELAGDREKARSYYAALVAVCEKADTDRPELQQAKAFLAKH